MLKLNINEEKQLTFEVQIGGVQSSQISSYLRMEIDNVEYGFPAVVTNESITVLIPPLRKVTNKQLQEGVEVEARLDLVADGNYLTPWKDTLKLTNPLFVEAKIIDSKFVNVSGLKTKETSIQENTKKKAVSVKEGNEIKQEKKEISEEEMTNRVVDKLTEKFSDVFENLIKQQSNRQEVVNETKRVSKPLKENSQIDKNISKPKVVKKKEVNLEDFKKKLTEDHIFKYMEQNGAKNPKIQNVLFEQATMAAKNNSPVEILKNVIKLMGKHKIQ